MNRWKGEVVTTAQIAGVGPGASEDLGIPSVDVQRLRRPVVSQLSSSKTGSCQTEEDDDRAIETYDVLVAESADLLTEARPCHGGQLVDHET